MPLRLSTRRTLLTRASADAHRSLAFAFARSLVFALLTVLIFLTEAAHAQTTPPPTSSASPSTRDVSVGSALRRSADRHGLWGSLGVGRGSAGLHCDACADGKTRAYALQGTIGVRLTSRFFVGAETFAWLDVIGGGVDRIARGTYLIARTYPFDGSSLFLNGGLGVASFEVNDGEVAFATRSPSLSIALGHDWHLSGLTLTPAVTAVMSTGGRLTSDRTGNAVTTNARLGLLRTSLALSWFR